MNQWGRMTLAGKVIAISCAACVGALALIWLRGYLAESVGRQERLATAAAFPEAWTRGDCPLGKSYMTEELGSFYPGLSCMQASIELLRVTKIRAGTWTWGLSYYGGEAVWYDGSIMINHTVGRSDGCYTLQIDFKKVGNRWLISGWGCGR